MACIPKASNSTPNSFSLLHFLKSRNSTAKPPKTLSIFLSPPNKKMAAKDIARKAIATTIRLTIPAGQARPGPPVGPALGQAGLNLMAFCKDFNARTQKFKPDAPMSVIISGYKDNTFEFIVKSPAVSWFLKKAAGLETAGGRAGHAVASTVSVKHVYEIAKVKKEDHGCQHLPLESICKSIVGTANSMGIKVVKELD